jgi:solute:Na+ symporter, SSS family
MIYYGIIGNVFPFSLIILMVVVLLATVISTADSFLMAGASSVVNDVIKPRLKGADDQRLLSYSRASVLIVSVLALFLALYIPELVKLWVTGTAMLVSGLLAPVLFGLFWKGTTRKAGVISMWIGLSVAVIWQISGHPFGLHPVFIGLPLSILTLFAVSLLSTQSEKDLLELELTENLISND